jgi:hypothetical protein
MAQTDATKLSELLGQVETDSEGLSGMLESLAAENPIDGDETEIKRVGVMAPPTMTWILIGLPTVRYGEIYTDIERIAAIEGVFCETAANEEGPDGKVEAD